MATIKSYTTIEQSRKLAEILPIESADMYWYLATKGNHKAMFNEGYNEYGDFELPCWSLSALFNVLPEGVIENYYAPNLQKENGKYSISYGNEELLCVADNPIDACVKLILKLHELNLL